MGIREQGKGKSEIRDRVYGDRATYLVYVFQGLDVVGLVSGGVSVGDWIAL